MRHKKILVAGFLMQAISIGLTLGTCGLFFPALVAEYKTGYAVISSGPAFFMVVLQLVGYGVGTVLDRGFFRRWMVLAAVAMSAGFFLMSHAQSLWQLGLLYSGVIACATAMVGPAATSILVAKNIVTDRGKALGIVGMGGPAGPLLLVLLSGYLINHYGWRFTLQCHAVLAACLVPVILWCVPRCHALADSATPDRAPADAAGLDRSIVHRPEFWFAYLPIGLVLGVTTGWDAHFPAFAQDQGYDVLKASQVLFGGAATGVVGAWGFGRLVGRYSPVTCLQAIIVWHVVVLLALMLPLPWGAQVFFMVSLGFVGGGITPVYAELTCHLFGLDRMGRAMGSAGLVLLPFLSLSPVLAGAIRDASGSYHSVLGVFASVMVATWVAVRGGLGGMPSARRDPSLSGLKEG